MADNHSIGSAYLSVVLKPQGDYTKDITDSLKSAGTKGGAEGGEAAGKEIEKGISTKSIVIGNIIANAITAGAKAGVEALGALFSDALGSFARFEQLSGGVDILFGADALTVLEDAQNAFKTAGLSANEYMQNVTSFSSALINSLGGDTAEAARIANMALVDMSDNVNTFGTDAEAVQRAYQGFARGNFTMLDNLSLGFSGTREGMQQLLDKAKELSGIEYDIGNLADIYEAVHVVQSSIGVTGKTASEAASTVEGSVGSLRAAWANWLTEMGKSDADIDRVTNDLVAAFVAAAENVVPAMGRIFIGFIKGIPQLVAEGAASLPDAIAAILSSVFGEGVGEGFSQAIAAINLEPLAQAFKDVGEFGAAAFEAVGEAWAEMQPLIEPLVEAVSKLATLFVEKILPFVVEVIGSGLIGFIAGVAGAVSGVLAVFGQLAAAVMAAPGAISNAFSTLQSTLVGVFTGAAEGIKGVFAGVVSYFAGIPGQIVGFFSGIGSAISGMFRSITLPHFTFSGSLNPLDWPSGGLPKISVEWYARGGIIDGARLIGVGEDGPEAVVPLSPGKLQPFGEAVADAMGGRGTTNIYIDGAKVNASEEVESLFYEFMRELSRYGNMTGGARVGYAV